MSAWSYSSMKLFFQCPKKYYHLRVAKDYKEPETEAMLYGTEVHKAAEDYIGDGVEIPAKYADILKPVLRLAEYEGDKVCELKMGITEDLMPCDFFADDVWYRGVADLIIFKDDKNARVIDYKTGRNTTYADPDQLELMALAMFAHYPELEVIKGGLLYLVPKQLIQDEYHRDSATRRWAKWINDHNKMMKAYDNDVWNPKTSGLCRRHCIVEECPHNGRSSY